MYKYRVDFYYKSEPTGDLKLVGSAEVFAWSRKEAWIESHATSKYKELVKNYSSGDIYFDSTRLDHLEEI